MGFALIQKLSRLPGRVMYFRERTVVHGFPGGYELKDRDIISIDCGVLYKGFHSDSAYTYPLPEASAEVLNLLDRTYESLFAGIEQAKAGTGSATLALRSRPTWRNLDTGGRELVGHGVGKDLHEDRKFDYGKRGKGVKIVRDVFAIEPMINMEQRV